MSIVLGDGADRLTVKVSRFGDFVAALIYDDNDPLTANEWPAGTEIEVRFYASETAETEEITWAAVISADRAEFYKTLAQVKTDVINPSNLTARLFYTFPSGVTLEWASGVVKGAN